VVSLCESRSEGFCLSGSIGVQLESNPNEAASWSPTEVQICLLISAPERYSLFASVPVTRTDRKIQELDTVDAVF